MRYHIGENGKPAQCKAKVRGCPVSPESSHYDSKEEAQTAIEKENTEKYQIKTSAQKETTPKKKLSAADKMRAKKQARVNDFAEIVTNSLERNEVRGKIIEADDKGFTLVSDTGERTKVDIRTEYDLDFNEINHYSVSGKGTTTNNFEAAMWAVEKTKE